VDSKIPLQIHEHLLASISPTLAADFAPDQAENDLASFRPVGSLTEQVLICFVTWAYLGDYSTETVGISSYVDQNFYSPNRPRRRKKRTTFWDDAPQPGPQPEYPPEPWAEPEPVAEPEPPTEPEPEQEPEPQREPEPQSPQLKVLGSGNSSTLSVNTPSTLSAESNHPLHLHIQIYVFARTYRIRDLTYLARDKIITYLKLLEYAQDGHIDQIFDMLNFAVTRLRPDNTLLDWLARYSSWKLNDLKGNVARFDALLELESGLFAKLLFQYVTPRAETPFTY